jgi:hypothetical protein
MQAPSSRRLPGVLPYQSNPTDVVVVLVVVSSIPTDRVPVPIPTS